MAIYTIQNKKLTAVSEKAIDLEKDIQSLTEANLQTIFGLKFISGSLNKEFSVQAQEQNFYIDTLAFDEAQRSIVLIEYKKDRSFSVIDQGFAYLAAMLSHKADFVLELNEKMHQSFKKEDIDWESSRVIFISPEFTNYQRNAINFKDLPFLLYEVNLYENNIIEYDAIKPYKTTESISKFTKDKIISDVTKEVKVYTTDDVINPQWQDMKKLFEVLKENIQVVAPLLQEHATKQYIAFRTHGSNIVYTTIRKNEISMAIRIHNPTIPVGLLLEKPNQRAWDTTPAWSTKITKESDIPLVIAVIKQAYEEYQNRIKK